jgi:parvulin-like peptidyl-prolyl isomerase
MANASAIFSLKPGDISGPITAAGNGVVAQLLEKQAPTDQEFTQKKDEIRQSLVDAKQNDMFGLFVTNLRKDMEKSKRLKVNEQEMKNLTKQGAQEGA